jgi:predicted DNA binding CopG/RHH family protein
VKEFEKKTERIFIRVSARLKAEIEKAAKEGKSAKFVRDAIEKNLKDVSK